MVFVDKAIAANANAYWLHLLKAKTQVALGDKKGARVSAETCVKMAEAAKNGNKLLESILDSTQLAIKVSLNSTYGFLGRGQGNLILKELGSIVTSVGRMLIEQTKEYAEGPFLEYIKESGVSSQRLEYQDYKLSDEEKRLVLKQFKI